MNRICLSKELDDCQTNCPYLNMKTELCIAAVTSSMIDKHRCFCERYKDCAILLVNNRKGNNRNVPAPKTNTLDCYSAFKGPREAHFHR